MALCNHSGNAIVLGEYPTAKKAIKECISMINSSDGWYYPSQYKVENNEILLNFLTEERNGCGDREKILVAAQKAASLIYVMSDKHMGIRFIECK